MRQGIFQGILPIKSSQLPTDIIAGITLAALNIPQAMGYTKIAGTPVITGLYAILIPTVLFALFGSSRHLVVGADSATAAILAAGLTGLAAKGSAEYVALCGLLALMAAGFLMLSRIIGLAFLANFLSRTVLVGFLTGVGIQVSLMEFGGMLGLARSGRSPVGEFMHVLLNLAHTNLYTLAVAAGVLSIIWIGRRISRKFPGALIAVVGAIVVSRAFDLSSYGVITLGMVPRGFPRVGWPQIELHGDLLIHLLPTAFSIFVVILAQSAATSRAYASRYDEGVNENRDLIGLSLANIGAGLSGTFVVNGSPTASAMVESAGGRSQLSQMTSSVSVLLVLLFLTGPLAYLPEAVLSAVVFIICMGLIDISGMRSILRQRPWEFGVAFITAATVVIVGVEQGILLAMFLSLLSHTRHGYRPLNSIIVSDQAGGWKTQPVNAAAQIRPGLMIYRFSHGMYYANAGLLTDQMLKLVKDAQPALTWFCIDAAAVDDIDFSAAEALRSIESGLKGRGIRLVFAELSDNAKRCLDRSELSSVIGTDFFFPSIGEVVDAYTRRTAEVGETD
jgi:high affinity sulfate transporter 1